MTLPILLFVVTFFLLCILARQVREQHLVVIALAILLVFLPLRESFNTWSIFIMSVLIVGAFIFDKSRRFTWQPVFYAVVCMYLLSFVGLIQVGEFNLANKRIDSALPMIIFPVLFSMVQLSKRNVILLLRFFLWAVIALCLYGILVYATAVSDFSLKAALLDGKQYFRLFTVWPIARHPSTLTVTLLMALPVSLYLRYHNGKQITRIEMLLAILLPIIVSLLVGARIAVAVTPLLLGLGYLFYCKFKPVFKWGVVATGVVAMSVVILLLPSDFRDRYTDQIRLDLKTVAISGIKEKPIFGWGTWQQLSLINCEERIQSLGVKFQDNFQHFHNQYLDSMVQFGIAGIVGLMWMILWIFWIAIRKKHFLLLSFMTMYIVVFQFDNVLSTDLFVVAFMFWLCFLVTNSKYLLEKNNLALEQK